MVKRKTVSMSRPRGTVRRHQGKSGPSREKLAQHAHLGPSRENTHPTRHKPRFLGHFPSLANYFAPRAQGCHNFETNGITKHPPRYKTLPATTVAHPSRYKLSQRAKKRLFLPKTHKQGEFCTARRAHELSRKSFQPNIASSPHQHR